MIQTCVQHSLHALVQPRLDGLADRLAGVVASAQNELRELARCVERSETRFDGRIAHVESKLAVIGDATNRAEQRERELNTRIAALAEGMLRRCAEDAQVPEAPPPQPACAVADLGISHGQVTDMERRTRDTSARMEVMEEICRKSAKSMRKLEDRIEGVEEQGRGVARLGKRLQGLLEEFPARGTAHEGSRAAQRIAALEEDMHALAARVAAPDREGIFRAQFVSIEQRVECQRVEIESALVHLSDRCQEAQTQASEQARKQDEQREELRTASEQVQASVARLDDMNLRVGALRVKVDGLDGRLAAAGERNASERVQGSCRLPDSQAHELTERCRRALGELEPRLEVLERQMGRLHEICDDAVEMALDRSPSIWGAPLSAAPRTTGLTATAHRGWERELQDIRGRKAECESSELRGSLLGLLETGRAAQGSTHLLPSLDKRSDATSSGPRLRSACP